MSEPRVITITIPDFRAVAGKLMGFVLPIGMGFAGAALYCFLFVTSCKCPAPGPGPGPGPTPVDPVKPAPIPDEGFRVLIVYESSELNKSQVPAITASKAFRDYCNSHCIKSGNTPEWRAFDKDVPMANESTIWQKAMLRPRQLLPWIIVSNGKTGFEGPLPPTVEETLVLMRKYGGP